jgi:hypothetical protein
MCRWSSFSPLGFDVGYHVCLGADERRADLRERTRDISKTVTVIAPSTRSGIKLPGGAPPWAETVKFMPCFCLARYILSAHAERASGASKGSLKYSVRLRTFPPSTSVMPIPW